jgi:chemotaxis protein CheZ
MGRSVQRKVFRVEQMLTRRPPARSGGDPRHNKMVDELTALRALADRGGGDGADRLRRELEGVYDAINRNKRELAALNGNAGDERRVTRANSELGAAVGGMEQATQKILMSAEIIDESAKTMSASLKKEFELGLTQDIQDHVIRIYEACNFQDLAGQRIAKVMATLKTVEDHVARMIALWDSIAPQAKRDAQVEAPERKLVNGPKLDGDSGHATQADIDAMFN